MTEQATRLDQKEIDKQTRAKLLQRFCETFQITPSSTGKAYRKTVALVDGILGDDEMNFTLVEMTKYSDEHGRIRHAMHLHGTIFPSLKTLKPGDPFPLSKPGISKLVHDLGKDLEDKGIIFECYYIDREREEVKSALKNKSLEEMIVEGDQELLFSEPIPRER